MPQSPPTTDSNWREKYYSTQEKYDNLRVEFQETVSQLKRDISRVSFAGNGVDKNLDEYLRLLRRDISQGAALEQVHKRVSEVSDTIKQLEDNSKKSQSNFFEAVGKLADPFADRNYSRGFKRQIKAFIKKSKTCDSSEKATKLLVEFAGIMQLLVTEFEEKESPQTGTTVAIWSRVKTLFLKKPQQKTESLVVPENTVDNTQSVTDLGLESSGPELPPQNALKPDAVYIPYAINLALLRLLDAMEFPGKFVERKQHVQASLEIHLTLDDLLSVTEAMVSLLLGAVSDEKHRVEDFVSKVNTRLDDVQQFLDHAKTNEFEKQSSTEQFEGEVKEHVADIQSGIKEADSLEQMQQMVEDRLDQITDKIDVYRKTEDNRMQEVLETITSINTRLHETEEAAKKLQHALTMQKDSATRDELTKLRNRAAYDREIVEAHQTFMRDGETVGVILCDIDHFKKINDTFGHAAGDQVLRIIGTLVSKNIRKSDFAARYGGEEFVLIFYGTDFDNIVKLAEKLRAVIENWKFTYDNNRVKVTMSFGVSQFVEGDDPASIFKRVDGLLYKAKNAGRNCVKFDSVDKEEE